MKIKFTNFGYHQLIEKRVIPLDRHVRKPKVLSVLEVIYFFASIGFGIGSYVSFTEVDYLYSTVLAMVCLTLICAAYFLAMESKWLFPLSLLSSVLIIAVCLAAFLKPGGTPLSIISFLAVLPLLNIGILLMSKRVRAYRRWVVSNA